MDFGQAETLPLARDQAAEGGGDRESLFFIDEVLDEIRAFEVGDRHLFGTGELVAHGLEDHIVCLRRILGGQDDRQEKEGSLLHFALSRLVGSGSRGGRSLDLAFFSISISETRIDGDRGRLYVNCLREG